MKTNNTIRWAVFLALAIAAIPAGIILMAESVEWADFGTFAVIKFAALAFLCLLYYLGHKAKQAGLLPQWIIDELNNNKA